MLDIPLSIPGAFHTAHAEGRGLYELPVLRCLWRPGLNGLGQGSSHSLRGGAAAAGGTHTKVSGRVTLARANAFVLLHVPAQCLFALVPEPTGRFVTLAV